MYVMFNVSSLKTSTCAIVLSPTLALSGFPISVKNQLKHRVFIINHLSL